MEIILAHAIVAIVVESFHLFFFNKFNELFWVTERKLGCFLVNLSLNFRITRWKFAVILKRVPVMAVKEVIVLGEVLHCYGLDTPVKHSVKNIKVLSLGNLLKKAFEVSIIRLLIKMEVPAVLNELTEFLRAPLAEFLS